MFESTSPFRQFQEEAYRLGFSLVGATPAVPASSFARYREWIGRGDHASMSYLAKRCEARAHPDAVLPGARTLLVLAASWSDVLSARAKNIDRLSGFVLETAADRPSPPFTSLRAEPGEPCGRVASYACGIDYHLELRRRLDGLLRRHRLLFPAAKARAVVDTAPVLERHYAVAAGLGTIGKNTMLLHPEHGSRFFLGILLSSEPFDSFACRESRQEDRFQRDTESSYPLCGDCTRCLDACPTGALREGVGIDARRCLNFWTIEQRETIPEEMATCLGERLFGCESCIAACPYNEETFDGLELSLQKILELDEQGFQAFFGRTPPARLGLEGLQRTAALLMKGR